MAEGLGGLRTLTWLVATAGALAACGRGGDSSGSQSPARVGRPAPGWAEPSIPGPTLSLASLKGKAVYLNFFATWCEPCKEEAPSIDAVARAYGPRGAAVVGVDVLESAQKAAEFRKLHGLSYPVVVDTGTLRAQYQVNGLPVHVFIDRSGVVQKIVVGELSPDAMRSNVERALR
jgi:cytochrome c biogenesis protein CcmG, thiol:disulfide interchange protein DsbE